MLHLVIIGDLHFVRIRSGPAEADAELVVDSDTGLPGAISFQELQMVTRKSEIVEAPGLVELIQLAPRGLFDRLISL